MKVIHSCFQYNIGDRVYHKIASDSGVIVARKLLEEAAGISIIYTVSTGIGTLADIEEDYIQSIKNVI